MRDFNSVSLNYWVIRKQIHYLQKSEASLLKEDFNISHTFLQQRQFWAHHKS